MNNFRLVSFLRTPKFLLTSTKGFGLSFRHSSSSSMERWLCSCGFKNFTFRGVCFHCHTPNPDASVKKSGIEAGETLETLFGEDDGARSPLSSDRSSHLAGAEAGQRAPFRLGDWRCQCGAHNFSRRTRCFACSAEKNGLIQYVIKPGDWICDACNGHNFRARTECFLCSKKRPLVEGKVEVSSANKTTPWTCQSCHTMNDPSFEKCMVCTAERSERQGLAVNSADNPRVSAKYPNDWKCPECAFINFQSRLVCRSCQTPKPLSGNEGDLSTERVPLDRLTSGDWKCTCGFMNFRFRDMCKMCGEAKGASETSSLPKTEPLSHDGEMSQDGFKAE